MTKAEEKGDYSIRLKNFEKCKQYKAAQLKIKGWVYWRHARGSTVMASGCEYST